MLVLALTLSFSLVHAIFNKSCVSFFDTGDWKKKGECSSIISWSSVYDSSSELSGILDLYFRMKPNHQCSFDPVELHLMLCSMLYAPCEKNHTLVRFPCRATCFETLKNCWSLTPLLSCHLLPETDCITNEEQNRYRSKQIKNRPAPVMMEMLVPIAEHGETQLVAPSDMISLERDRTIHDLRNLFSQSEDLDKEKLYLNIVSIAKRLLSLNRTRFDTAHTDMILQTQIESSARQPTTGFDLQWADEVLQKIISKIKSQHTQLPIKANYKKNLTCTSDISSSSNQELRSVCMNYISWKSWTDRSGEFKQIHKYFELRPTYHCTYDPIELHTLVCLTAYSPCDQRLKHVEICQDACFSILRNCWPLTSVFKCGEKPTNSCVPIEDVNKYRSRYMKRNPPSVSMEILSQNPTSF